MIDRKQPILDISHISQFIQFLYYMLWCYEAQVSHWVFQVHGLHLLLLLGCPVELVLETDDGVQDLPNTSLPLGELPSPGGNPSPASLPSQKVENDRSPYASLANWSVPGEGT